MVDAAPDAERYCTDGYSGYLDVVFPGKHIFNIHNKNDTFTVEGVNADLRHYIPTLARRSRCFPRKLENLQAVLAVFVRVYNRFGLQKHLYRSRHPGPSVPFSLFDFSPRYKLFFYPQPSRGLPLLLPKARKPRLIRRGFFFPVVLLFRRPLSNAGGALKRSARVLLKLNHLSSLCGLIDRVEQLDCPHPLLGIHQGAAPL